MEFVVLIALLTIPIGLGLIVSIASRTRLIGEDLQILRAQLDRIEKWVRGPRVAPDSATAKQEVPAPVQRAFVPRIEPVVVDAATNASLKAQPHLQPPKFPRLAPLYPAPATPSLPKVTTEDLGLEERVGMRWLVRVGAVLVLVGMGFLYQYAVEQGWMAPELRAILGMALGGAMMGLGEGFRRRGYDALAQGFSGAGVAVLYLTLWAANSLWKLVPDSWTFGGMTAVTLVTVLYATRTKALSLAILAALGGFLTPLLTSSGSDQTLLLAYVFLLDLGFLTIAWKRSWPSLRVLTGAGTLLLYVLQSSRDIESGFWLAAYIALFLLATTGPALLRRTLLDRVSLVHTLIFSALAGLLVGFSGHTLFNPDFRETEFRYEYLLLLLLGALHLAVSETFSRRLKTDDVSRNTLWILGAGGAVFATRELLDHHEYVLTLVLAAVGLGAMLHAQWRKFDLGMAIGGGVVALAIGRVFTSHLPTHPWAPALLEPAFWNGDFGTALGVVAAISIAAWRIPSLRTEASVIAFLLGLIILGHQTDLALDRSIEEPLAKDAARTFARLFHVGIGMTGLAFQSARKKMSALAALSLLAAAFSLYLFGQSQNALLSVRSATFLINGYFLGPLILPALLWVIARPIASLPTTFFRRAATGIRPASVVLLLVALTVEAYRAFSVQGDHLPLSVTAGSAAVSVTWTAFAAVLLLIGIWKSNTGCRLGALALFAITLLKVVFNDLANLERVYRTISFIALGAVLMAGAWLYHRFSNRVFPTKKPHQEKDPRVASS